MGRPKYRVLKAFKIYFQNSNTAKFDERDSNQNWGSSNEYALMLNKG